jgi:CheY-like chemotaxis protein
VSGSPQPHVLLVEDNQLVIDALRILFEAVGRRVTAARSIVETLAVIDKDAPALVLLDLRLPDGDGLSLVEPLRSRGAVVVAVTGDDDPSMRQRCLEAGCVDVLIKPVPLKDLMAAAERWIA